MHQTGPLTVLVVLAAIATGSSSGRPNDGKRGDTLALPPPLPWSTAPAAQVTYRHKGDFGDLDPRGSVRYNFAPNGRIMRGIITKQREVPIDDLGTGIEQAKTDVCCNADSY